MNKLNFKGISFQKQLLRQKITPSYPNIPDFLDRTSTKSC